MRVALVRPMASCSSYDPEVQEPLGIELLAAVLRENGHKVLLQDVMLFPQTEEKVAHTIEAFGPQVVGLSLMSDADLEFATTLLDFIQKHSITRPVMVAGGSFVSTEPDRAASLLPEKTVLIRYEGEKRLIRLLEAIENHEPLPDGPALQQHPAKAANCSSTDDWAENLDSLPWPARDLANQVLARCGVMNVQGSRGCTGCCAYCCMPGMPRSARQSWRGRSPENIVGELSDLNRKYGAAAFNFVDDDFLGPPQDAEKRSLSFADAIDRRSLKIGFGAQLRPQALNLKIIEALARAGLAWAFIGVENDDPDTLQKWRRPPISNELWHCIEKLRNHRVEVAAGAILFHPGATLDTVRRFSLTLQKHDLLNYRTATSRLHLLPGSHMYEMYRRNGGIPVGALGPFTPPIPITEVERLFAHLVHTLTPMRPCWIHAACQLPGLVSQNKAGAPVAMKLEIIRDVLHDMDTWVFDVFNTLIDKVESKSIKSQLLADAHAGSRELALFATDRLQEAKLIADPEQLREAIDVEGGI